MRAVTSNIAALLIGTLLVGSVDPTLAAPITRNGTLRVTATVAIKSTIPTTTALNGRIFVFASTSEGGSRTISANATLTRSGNTATATFILPYAWTLPDTNSTLRVTFSVAPNPGDGGALTGIIIPLPAEGATTAIALPASI